uniref:Sodium/hydrogen exchanger n=1 Tax=Culicoides sonorensis TaxID=179676 RepID=A0A336KHH8_CULSO
MAFSSMMTSNHRVCNCQSCRKTHDHRNEFSYGAKISSSIVATQFDEDDNNDEITDENFVRDELQFQDENLVNLVFNCNGNQSNINVNTENYYNNSQLHNNPSKISILTSDTLIERRKILTHDSTNYNLLDHDFNNNNNNNFRINRVWKLRRSNSLLDSIMKQNTFLLLVVSTIFLLTISNGVSAGPINATQIAEITTERNLFKEVGFEEHETEHGHAENYPVITIDFLRVETPFIIGIWILFASIAKIGFHMTPKLHTIFPESCLLIVVGVIVGTILLYATNVHVSPLTPDTFFFYMLPPIIFDAGYFMPNRLFFDNLGTILLMAVVGTIFNIATIGTSLWAVGTTGLFGVETPFLHMFLFSSLISAVDPVAVLAVFEEIHVNEILYIVVFGESLLNDAVTVVLYHMFEGYNEMGVSNIKPVDIASGGASFLVVALGGTVIGIIWGFLTGLITRFTEGVRVIEPIFIFVMAYLAYLSAEIFHMSGILAITFCGMAMKNYVEANISHKSHTTIKYALKMIASSSETIIFMFLGVATINSGHVWNTWFVVLTILFCTVFRAIGVLVLVNLANRFRIHKLSNVDQFVMSYGGLRGAIAFALVLLIDKKHIPLQPMFMTTTIAVVYFTVFLQGITIKPLVRILNVKKAEKRKPTMNERIHERFIDHMMAGIEDIIGKTGNYNIRDKFKRFDNRFIRPLLIRDLKGAEPKILETYSKLAMKDAMDFMKRNPSTLGQMPNTESMSALFRNYTQYFGGRFAPNYMNTCPSFSNLELSTRNLDMHELDYAPSKKDLTDARIHHLLAEELKPYRRHRRLSYSRHAVDDRDLSTQQVNYKMPLNIRRMVCDRKHHKRSKKNKDGSKSNIKQNHVSFPEFAQNGSAKQFANGTIRKNSLSDTDISPLKKKKIKIKENDDFNIYKKFRYDRKYSHGHRKYRRLELDYLNDVLHEEHEDEEIQKEGSPNNEEWDSGLTFTAKSSPGSPASSSKMSAFECANNSTSHNINNNNKSNNNLNDSTITNKSLIAHITNLPGFDSSKARIVKQSCFSSTNGTNSNTSYNNSQVGTPILPTAAETFLPWRRDRSYQAFDDARVSTPTATEKTLPWKRDNEGEEEYGIQQNEFPSWVSNKEYLAYHSPSATFLGGLTKPKAARSVIGLFRRESTTSAGDDAQTPHNASGTSNEKRGRDKRSASIAIGATVFDEELMNARMHHAGQFPVTASHRRNNRRASMLEMGGSTIPEESCKTPLFEEHDEWEPDNTSPTSSYGSSSKRSSSRTGRRNHNNSRGGGGGETNGSIGSRTDQPLLKLTPKLTGKRSNQGPSASLLSNSSSEHSSEDDEDYDEGKIS